MIWNTEDYINVEVYNKKLTIMCLHKFQSTCNENLEILERKNSSLLYEFVTLLFFRIYLLRKLLEQYLKVKP